MCHNFFLKKTQLDKGSIRIPGKISHKIYYLFFYRFFPLGLFVSVKKIKSSETAYNFSPKNAQLDKGIFRIPREILYEIDYSFSLSLFFPIKRFFAEILLD